MRSRSSVANTKALAESIAAGTAPPHPPPPDDALPKGVSSVPVAPDEDIKPPRRRSEARREEPPTAATMAGMDRAMNELESEEERNQRGLQDAADAARERDEKMGRTTDDVAAIGRQREALPPSTPSHAGELEMGNGFQRVVTHLFDFQGDPMETYERVRESLRLGTRASQASYGTLVDALDQAEEMASTAMELLINAKVTHDAFEIDSKIVKAALWDQATQALEADKKAGTRTKQIVIADIESWIAVNHPDEWRALEVKIGQARRMVAMLEDLAERTRQRAGHLRVMARGSTRE